MNRAKLLGLGVMATMFLSDSLTRIERRYLLIVVTVTTELGLLAALELLVTHDHLFCRWINLIWLQGVLKL